DEKGRRVPWGVKGELYISGPQVGRGYLNRPEENKTGEGVSCWQEELIKTMSRVRLPDCSGSLFFVYICCLLTRFCQIVNRDNYGTFLKKEKNRFVFGPGASQDKKGILFQDS
ncbi:MAG: AMP-binding protein, partial [Bacteroidales bacterium]|nr:AMP-binding protein [Bacteroidales bacterium]